MFLRKLPVKKMVVSLFMVGVFAALFTSQAVFAHAAIPNSILCSGHGCDHTDPATMGCTTDGTAVSSVGMNGVGATVYEEWSNACQTNWARVATGAYITYNVKIVRLTDGATEQYTYDSGGAYTYQLYAPAGNNPVYSNACMQWRWDWYPTMTDWTCAPAV